MNNNSGRLPPLTPEEMRAADQRHANATAVIERELRAKVRAVARDESVIGVYSTGEQLAIALVLDRPALWAFFGSALQAFDRLEPEWIAAALRVQRDGWD